MLLYFNILCMQLSIPRKPVSFKKIKKKIIFAAGFHLLTN